MKQAKIDKSICEEFCKHYGNCTQVFHCNQNAMAAKVRKVTAGKARRWIDDNMWELDDSEKNKYYQDMGLTSK